MTIHPCELPDEALLRQYRENGAYTDCFRIEVAGAFSQAQYIEAFYTTRLFKLERLLLGWFASRPSTDAQARALATGESDAFAAWRVEGRTPDQLLMCDLQGRTRSWLMSEPAPSGRSIVTLLYFGSAVLPVTDARSGRKALGLPFQLLLGFHKVYSRLLLGAAVSRVFRGRKKNE